MTEFDGKLQSHGIKFSVNSAGDVDPLVIDVAVLLGGRREAVLIHNDDAYRLRITSRGRLLLTK